MSMLHRQLLGEIMKAIDPVLETGLSVVNPAIGAGARVLLTDVEQYVEAPEPVAPVNPEPNPICVAGKSINSPLPAAPVDQQPAPDAKPADVKPADTKPAAVKPTDTKPADAKPAPPAPPVAVAVVSRGEVLTAREVIDALMATLQELSKGA